MKTKEIIIKAQSATGWAMRTKLTDAIRVMIHQSKGGADGKLSLKMSLGNFLDLIDEQEISLRLIDKEQGLECGCFGDNYNEAKLFDLN